MQNIQLDHASGELGVRTQSTPERGVFERPAQTFELDPRVIGWILADAANPLNRIAKIIPAGAAVLDIGAGNGILARLLGASGHSFYIDAIEPDPVAEKAAAPYYRSIFKGGLEEYLDSSDSQKARYDFVVMADVMEHLANPEPVLKRLKSLLSPGGRIVISTPNVAFGSVRLAMLNGCFDYVDSGILERTHLRFYTRKTLHHLFSVSGLYSGAEYHCLRDPLASEVVLDNFPLMPWAVTKIARDDLSFVYQFLFVLCPAPCATTIKENLGARVAWLPIKYLVQRARRGISGFFRQVQASAGGV